MNLEIPRNNRSELIFFLWKIIDLPQISLNNLLYKISFELFLFPPEEATEFVDTCIENNLIVVNKKGDLSVYESLGRLYEFYCNLVKFSILVRMELISCSKVGTGILG